MKSPKLVASSAALFSLILSACSSEPAQEETLTELDPSGEETTELNFVADEGIRMTYASNAGAKVDEDGKILLLYEANGGKLHGQYVATSEDGLTYEEAGEQVTFEEAGAFRSKQLPDGMWISYGFDSTKGGGSCLTSQSSSDGKKFTSDLGCRYTLTEDDGDRMGVYEFFNDSKGGVVLLYLADLEGMNNVRRAYSTDGGQSFTFTNGDVLGDEKNGGGAQSYVDQKVWVLENGDIFLVAMRGGAIYGFMSTDDGETFELVSEDPILEATDFPDTEYGEARSLHDPQLVELPDGRYRIYVTLIYGDRDVRGPAGENMQSLVSATTSGN